MPRGLYPTLVLLAAMIGMAASGHGQNLPVLLPVTAWQGRTMGSDYTVKIVDDKLAEAQLTALKAELEATLIEVNRQMSNYLPDSELSRFNKTPENTPFKVSPDFTKVTRWALELSRLSNGAFDPTLGPLINLWGFGETSGNHAVPSAEALRTTLAKTGWRHLTINADGSLTKDLPGLALDLGAVAKGFGVDQMIRVLQAHGLANCYASIAGEVRVTGHNPRGTKWVLGISVPTDHWREDNPMATQVSISNQALATSGDYQKFFRDASGRRLSHLIDPRTGTPVQHHVAGVTVVGPDSMTADGLSTTLYVLGLEAGLKFIDARENAAALFILRENDGTFRQVASSRFAKLTGTAP
ncbi:MAG: FAD:protein FMN transferase [Akkermansiaceae bacterium]|nr:FAD:protein FMN transferase [Akkermansiaceae bacterium]